MIGRWLIAFVFTQLVEVPLYARALRGDRRPLLATLAIAFGASAITHPVVWFVFPRVVDGFWLRLVLSEVFAVLAEAAYFTACTKMPRPLLVAFAVNMTSVSLGFASRAAFGVP